MNSNEPVKKSSKQKGERKTISFNSDVDDEKNSENINDNVNNINSNSNDNNNNSNNDSQSPKNLQKTVSIHKEEEDLNKTKHEIRSKEIETFSFSAPKVKENNDKQMNNTEEKREHGSRRSSSSSSIDSDSNKKENKNTNAHESDNHENSLGHGDKVLIEKDGKFLYVDSDEYTAIERERIALLEAEEKKLNDAKVTEKPPLLPHPPTRPKTSTGRNVHRVSTQDSQKINSNSEKKNNSDFSGPLFVRNAHSADGRSRQP